MAFELSAPFPPDVALDRSALSLPRVVIGDKTQRPQPQLQPLGNTTQGDNGRTGIGYLPGYPTVSLDSAQVRAFLQGELATPIIDELHHLFWLLSMKSGGNIDPLHRQRVKGRTIMPTDEAKLHLVWTKDSIYVKPLPVCLLNHTVWEVFLAPEEQFPMVISDPGFDRKVALGFLRTYSYLVRSPLDFALAKEAHLIPEDLDIDWIRWMKFIAHFRGMDDSQVSKRYHFGQIRLNRLNWAMRIMMPKAGTGVVHYHRQHWSVATAISQWFSILLFSFASLSLVLSSMQVALTVPPDHLSFAGLDEQRLGTLKAVFWIFSILTIVISALTWLMLALIPLGVFATYTYWAVRTKGIPGPKSRIKQPASHVFPNI
jgi:hypothetical protein